MRQSECESVKVTGSECVSGSESNHRVIKTDGVGDWSC